MVSNTLKIWWLELKYIITYYFLITNNTDMVLANTYGWVPNL